MFCTQHANECRNERTLFVISAEGDADDTDKYVDFMIFIAQACVTNPGYGEDGNQTDRRRLSS